MAHSPAIGIGQIINPDHVSRIEISRNAPAETTQVRVFMTGTTEPCLFEFRSMSEAIRYYEQLWSRRTLADDEVESNTG